MKKVLVCGGRYYGLKEGQRKALRDTLDELRMAIGDFVIINGNCMRRVDGILVGADWLATEWGMDNRLEVHTYPADWEKYGRSAGPRRNEEMISKENIDLAVVCKGGCGTADMVRRLEAAGVSILKVR